MQPNLRVAVLGAGLQGSCVAMDLSESGIAVDLYDRNQACMTQASLRNEGKIHLGYVYANDRSLRSAMTMTEGAATFAPLLERWLGTPVSRLNRSTAFNYAVHRDSIITPSEFEAHLTRTHALVAQRIRGLDYLGVDVSRPPVRLSRAELESDYDPATVDAVYRTAEHSVDPRALAMAVRERITSDPRITLRLGTEVNGVRSENGHVAVEFTNDSHRNTQDYDHVVNALWDGRLVVDQTMGMHPESPWLFRVKHFLRVKSSSIRVPSTTIVLGPFGDIVDYGNGEFYLSWYPSGLQGASSEATVPDRLRSLSDREVDAIRAGTVSGLTSVVPRLADVPAADLADAELAGGVIFAWGATDIDDRASGLHNRYAIGPRTLGRYHSVDTGKLTTAPMYARMVGERVRGDR
jgi:glycine/D-amino acid oxidase-like deaminating enzyme